MELEIEFDLDGIPHIIKGYVGGGSAGSYEEAPHAPDVEIHSVCNDKGREVLDELHYYLRRRVERLLLDTYNEKV